MTEKLEEKMCGENEAKKKFFELKFDHYSHKLIERNVEGVLGSLRAEMESLEDMDDEEIRVSIKVVEMTETEVNNLPEFDGF